MMSGKRAAWLSLLLLAVFSGVVFLWRLPASDTVSLRAERRMREDVLQGGDEKRTAQELLPGERLDLNRADAEELQKLPGIGPALSEAILQYREAHGPFTCVEQLLDVPGIGQARFAAIADSVMIGESS